MGAGPLFDVASYSLALPQVSFSFPLSLAFFHSLGVSSPCSNTPQTLGQVPLNGAPRLPSQHSLRDPSFLFFLCLSPFFPSFRGLPVTFPRGGQEQDEVAVFPKRKIPDPGDACLPLLNDLFLNSSCRGFLPEYVSSQLTPLFFFLPAPLGPYPFLIFFLPVPFPPSPATPFTFRGGLTPSHR